MILWRNIAIAFICTLAANTSVAAGDTESSARISAAARSYIAKHHPWQSQKTRIDVGQLDPRTRLPRCSRPLQAFMSPGAEIRRRSTVGVRCSGDKPWKIYLPVTVAAYARVMVSKHPIAPGQTVTAADISWVEREVSSLGYGYLRSLKQAGGLRSRRSIAQGAVITANMLEAGNVVSKGQQLKLLSNSGAIRVSMKGIALQDGALGARIRVRNLSSGKELEGRVDSAGQVLLN